MLSQNPNQLSFTFEMHGREEEESRLRGNSLLNPCVTV